MMTGQTFNPATTVTIPSTSGSSLAATTDVSSRTDGETTSQFTTPFQTSDATSSSTPTTPNDPVTPTVTSFLPQSWAGTVPNANLTDSKQSTSRWSTSHLWSTISQEEVTIPRVHEEIAHAHEVHSLLITFSEKIFHLHFDGGKFKYIY